MKSLFIIAAAAFTVAGGIAASPADAQRRDAPRYAQDDGYRGDRYDRRGEARNIRYWRDGLGRRCYRRSDGVRRCEADGRRGDRYARRR